METTKPRKEVKMMDETTDLTAIEELEPRQIPDVDSSIIWI